VADDGAGVRRGLGLVRRLRSWLVAATALLGMAALGAAGAPVASAHPASLGMTIEGWKVNWWAPVEPSSDCYAFDGGVGGGMYSYLPLLWINGNDSINYQLSIASSIKPSNRDRTFTIAMNPKWRWSNGAPVTAQDVVLDFNLLKAASQPNSPLPYCFAQTGGMPQGWKSVTAPNPHTLVVTTTTTVNPVWFELNGLAQLVPVPSVWNKYANMTKELNWINSVAANAANPVYKVIDGPYNISKAVEGQYYVYTWNPNYSGLKPKIHTVIYYYEASDASNFAALKTGQAQIGLLPASLWNSRSQLTGDQIQTQPMFGYSWIALNLSSKTPGVGALFSNLYVRQALQDGIDQPAIVQSIMHGVGTPSIGPVPQSTVYFDKAMKNPYPYDPAKGRALLEAHGWKMVHGVMMKNGQKLAFQIILTPGSQTTTNELLAIQQAWASEGIAATVNEMGANTASSIVGNPKAQNKWAASFNDYWIYVPDYYPSGEDLFGTGDAINLGGFSDPKEDALIKATLQGGTPAQVQARFDAYQAYTTKVLPGVLWIPSPDNINVVSSQVGGWNKNFNLTFGGPPINYLYWK